MADVDFDEFDDGYAAPGTGADGRVWCIWRGPLCSVALIVRHGDLGLQAGGARCVRHSGGARAARSDADCAGQSGW